MNNAKIKVTLLALAIRLKVLKPEEVKIVVSQADVKSHFSSTKG